MTILAIKSYKNLVLYWLLTLIFLLITMIVVGGLTRLTDSGLSITKWELFRGVLWPKNFEEWEFYFSQYKEIPQFKLINPNMSLAEFKVIYFWEWFHRILGRTIGLFFLIPFIYFVIKNSLTKEYKFNFLIIFILICSQGVLGWYMVESGLVDLVSVSHYRLSSHLFVAFVILSSLIWILFNFITSKNKKFFMNKSSFFSIKIFLFLIFFQIIFGAFVSGLDAGRLYQTWPLMNENLVQFFHRTIAYIIFFLIILIGFEIFKKKPRRLLKPYFLVLFFVFLQIILGIYTLTSNLNIYVASLHQISSIFLTILSLNLYHRSIN